MPLDSWARTLTCLSAYTTKPHPSGFDVSGVCKVLLYVHVTTVPPYHVRNPSRLSFRFFSQAARLNPERKSKVRWYTSNTKHRDQVCACFQKRSSIRYVMLGLLENVCRPKENMLIIIIGHSRHMGIFWEYLVLHGYDLHNLGKNTWLRCCS